MQREFISEIAAINSDKSAAAEGWQSNGLLLLQMRILTVNAH